MGGGGPKISLPKISLPKINVEKGVSRLWTPNENIVGKDIAKVGKNFKSITDKAIHGTATANIKEIARAAGDTVDFGLNLGGRADWGALETDVRDIGKGVEKGVNKAGKLIERGVYEASGRGAADRAMAKQQEALAKAEQAAANQRKLAVAQAGIASTEGANVDLGRRRKKRLGGSSGLSSSLDIGDNTGVQV